MLTPSPVCREKKAINAFLDSTVRARKPGSIYICGKPGTGKTAIVKGVCDEMKRKKIRTVSLNGMTLTGGAKDLFTELLKAVCPAAVRSFSPMWPPVFCPLCHLELHISIPIPPPQDFANILVLHP